MNVYLDIESDGILEHITRIHCIGYAIDNQPVAIVDGSDIQPWLDGLPKDATIVGHNVIGFDLPALHKVFGWKWKGGVEDTMLISMMDNPDRVGGHSLDNLAKLVRMEKGDPGGGWDTYTPAMASYCKLDVEILRAVHKALSSKLKAKGDPAKAMYIEHKFAAIFASQGVAGVHVDQKHCVEVKDFIEKEMQDIADKVEPLMPQVEMGRGELNSVTPPKIQFKKDGTPSAVCLKFFDTVGKEGDVWRATKDGVTVVLPHHEPLYTKRAGSMKDDAQLKAWMMDQGWEPAFWNYKKRPDKNGKMRWEKTDDGELVKTSPKFKDQGTMCPNLEKLVTEGVFDESIKLAAKWVVLRHRLGLVKGVMSRLRPDGRVCATGFSYGTPTSRVRHVAPVCNIPKADKTVLLGKEMRAMFCAAPDKTLVGVDAAGLEFRCLAHYMGDDDFTEAVVNGDSKKGTDVHTVMQKVCSEYVPSRSVQKNVSYCVPMDTKALTRKGWKLRHELSVGDEILTYNADKGVKEWAPIEAIHDTSGEVFHLHHGHGFSVRATADHRWFVRQRRKTKTGRIATDTNYWKEEVRTTKELNTESNIITNAPMSPDDEGTPLSWEGDKFGMDWIREVCNAPSSQRKAFLAGFLIADGHMNPKSGGWCFSQLRNELYEAALTAAYIEGDGNLYVTERHQSNGNTCMQVKMSAKGHVTMQRMKQESVGIQDVWCVTTRNGSWVMRQGDCITITGNCFLYGGGDKKIGLTAGHPINDAVRVGGAIRASLAEGLPQLGRLMRQCEKWGKEGRIVAIDGRIIPIRMPHATLNMLLQSCGSITVKLATILAWQNIVRQRLRGTRQVIHMHDEVQYETVPQYAEAVGQCFVDGLQEAGRKLKLVCPLDGDIMIGKNWSETH